MHRVFKPLYRLNSNPILYKGKNFHFVYFGLFAGLASFFGLLLFFYYMNWKGVPATSNIFLISLTLAICAWGCARIGYLISTRIKLKESFKKHLNQTGFYSQAAILGTLLIVGIFSWIFSFPYLIVADGLAFTFYLALWIARLGCYNYGCCYGKPTASRWGAKYVHPQSKVLRIVPALKGIAVHPIPLYSSFLNLGAFLIIFSQVNRSLPAGAIISFALFYYGIKRTVLDRLRDESYVGGKPKRLISGYTALTFLSAAAFFNFSHPSVPTTTPFSLMGWIHFLMRTPSVIFLSALASLVLFLGYGYHGKTLGTFLNREN